MLDFVLPKSIDNRFPGHKIALYVFYALTVLTLWRSQHHLFAPDGGAQSIASIPLDTYPGAAAETIVGIFALWGLSQLIIGMIYLLAAVRYRSMIPALYLLFAIEYAMRLWVGANKSIETAGTAPGSMINLPFMILGLILFALSVWRPRTMP
ncbi:MAG: hypothetical protein MK160_16625 [Rhodobacteraceae bacterium]|nr:hypothetical protein [Paracoccaceae bacterium]